MDHIIHWPGKSVHGARKEAFTSKVWEQNESSLRTKRKNNWFFRQNEFLYNVQHKERKNMKKKSQKFEINMGQRYKIFCKKEKEFCVL